MIDSTLLIHGAQPARATKKPRKQRNAEHWVEQAKIHGPTAEDIPETVHDLDAQSICDQWAQWVDSKKFFCQPPVTKNILAKMQKEPGRVTGRSEGPDAPLSQELYLLNMIISGKPESRGRTVFVLTYLHRIRGVERAASMIGMSRAAWYRNLSKFQNEVCEEMRRQLNSVTNDRDAVVSTDDYER